MTVEEYCNCILLHQWREKLISKLCVEFPQHVRYAEDVAQGFLARINPEKFNTPGELGKYLFDNVGHRMQNVIKKDKGRRKIARTLKITTPRKYDPTRRIDRKIDLERAICAVVPAGPLRAAMWHMAYEGYTQDEVEAMLAGHPGASQSSLSRAMTVLNIEMRRKGYRGV